MQFYPSVRKSLPTHIQREFKGINKLDAFSISDSFATDMKNLISDKYPALSVRSGYSVLGTVGSEVIGLGVWKDTELHAVFNDGTWRKWNGSSWVTLASGLNTSAEWTFTNFKGGFTDINLIGSNGVDAARRYDGSTVQTLSTAPSGINFIEQYADRLYGVTAGNTLHFTVYRVGDDWTTVNQDDADSGYIVVETPDGENITSVKSGIGHVTVFKPNSIHELFGNSPSNYTMQTVTFEVGCVNNKSVVNVGGTLYFIHSTGIYEYKGGTAPSKAFSLPVQDYIDQADKSNLGAFSAGTDGNKIYFSIPSVTLVYDPKYQTWNVWKDFTPNHILGWKNILYMGDTSGRVLKWDSLTDNGTAITWNWISKPFNSGALDQLIRWLKLWFTVDVPSGSTINVYLSKSLSGNDWVNVGSISGSLNSTRIPLIPSQMANAYFIRLKLEGTGPVTVYEFAREQRELPVV